MPVFADEKKQLCCMSIGFMLENKDDSVVWRGPKKTGMFRRFFSLMNIWRLFLIDDHMTNVSLL